MPVPTLNVVAETPDTAHGEIAESPMPAPNAISSSVSAALAKPPAATAPHDIAASGATTGWMKSVSAATMETSAALKSVMVRPRLRIVLPTAHAVGQRFNHRNSQMVPIAEPDVHCASRHPEPSAESRRGTGFRRRRCRGRLITHEERAMGFGRGVLLWLLGVPLPFIILLALFWHH